MDSDTVIIRCGSCGTANRVPRARLEDRPVCGKCRASLGSGPSQGRPVDVTDQTFEGEVLSQSGGVLVDCWAPWCGPCRMVAPVLEELASDYAGRIKIAKLNVDENPATASRYQTRSIPTMLLFKDGVQVDRLVGAMPRQELERHIQRLL
jgi:thioredoxin 2